MWYFCLTHNEPTFQVTDISKWLKWLSSKCKIDKNFIEHYRIFICSSFFQLIMSESFFYYRKQNSNMNFIKNSFISSLFLIKETASMPSWSTDKQCNNICFILPLFFYFWNMHTWQKEKKKIYKCIPYLFSRTKKGINTFSPRIHFHIKYICVCIIYNNSILCFNKTN